MKPDTKPRQRIQSLSESSVPKRTAKRVRSPLAFSRRLVTAAALVSVATGALCQSSLGSDTWPTRAGETRAGQAWAPVSQPAADDHTSLATRRPGAGGVVRQPMAGFESQRGVSDDLQLTIRADASGASRSNARVWANENMSSHVHGQSTARGRRIATAPAASLYTGRVQERFDRMAATLRPPARDYSADRPGSPSKTFPSASPSLTPVVQQSLQTSQRMSPNAQGATQFTAGVTGASDVPSHVSGNRSAVTTKSMWLQSATPMVHRQAAVDAIAKATHEYKVRAWASAEASAWRAIEVSAEGIDLAVAQSAGADVVARYSSPAAEETATAMGTLLVARTAIRESRDFAAVAASNDPDLLAGVVRSHQTDVLQAVPLNGLSRNESIDRYLNEARVQLSKIASVSIEAAQAMDLLAAIYLGRDDYRKVPGPTSLCLRRAAFKGQPQNGSLASTLGRQLAGVGLYNEAQWVLCHAMQIAPDVSTAQALVVAFRQTGDVDSANRVAATYLQNSQSASAGDTTRRAPAVIQVSPQQFAQMSRQYAHTHPNMNAARPTGRSGGGPNTRQTDPPVVSGDSQPPSTVARVVDSFRRLW